MDLSLRCGVFCGDAISWNEVKDILEEIKSNSEKLEEVAHDQKEGNSSDLYDLDVEVDGIKVWIELFERVFEINPKGWSDDLGIVVFDFTKSDSILDAYDVACRYTILGTPVCFVGRKYGQETEIELSEVQSVCRACNGILITIEDDATKWQYAFEEAIRLFGSVDTHYYQSSGSLFRKSKPVLSGTVKMVFDEFELPPEYLIDVRIGLFDILDLNKKLLHSIPLRGATVIKELSDEGIFIMRTKIGRFVMNEKWDESTKKWSDAFVFSKSCLESPPKMLEAVPKQNKQFLITLLSGPGNDKCCDCGTENPSHIMLDFEGLVCLTCAMIHSRSKSFKSRIIPLDEGGIGETFKEKKLLTDISARGNRALNLRYEACTFGPKPDPTASWREKQEWITMKYTLSFIDVWENEELFLRLSNEEEVDLSVFQDITDGMLKYLLEKNKKIKKLKLKGCKKITSSVLFHTLRILEDLELLDLSNCNPFIFGEWGGSQKKKAATLAQKKCIEQLSKSPKIKSLSFSGLVGITNEAFSMLLRSPNFRLSYADFKFCRKFENSSLELLTGHPIEELYLTNCSLLTSEAITKIIRASSDTLRVIHIDFIQIENDALRAMSVCLSLESLSISGCSGVSFLPDYFVDHPSITYLDVSKTMLGLEDFEKISSFHKLNTLKINSLPQLSDINMGKCKTLRHVAAVSLGGGRDDFHLSNLVFPKGIKSLNFSDCPKYLEQEDFCKLVKYKNLTSLLLQNTSIDDNSVNFLCSELGKLTSLDISTCSNIAGSFMKQPAFFSLNLEKFSCFNTLGISKNVLEGCEFEDVRSCILQGIAIANKEGILLNKSKIKECYIIEFLKLEKANLVQFGLAGRSLSMELIRLLASLEQLRSLDVSGCKLPFDCLNGSTIVPSIAFTEAIVMENDGKISLRECPFVDIDFVKNLLRTDVFQTLKQIDFTGCAYFDDFCFLALQECEKLETIALENTGVSKNVLKKTYNCSLPEEHHEMNFLSMQEMTDVDSYLMKHSTQVFGFPFPILSKVISATGGIDLSGDSMHFLSLLVAFTCKFYDDIELLSLSGWNIDNENFGIWKEALKRIHFEGKDDENVFLFPKLTSLDISDTRFPQELFTLLLVKNKGIRDLRISSCRYMHDLISERLIEAELSDLRLLDVSGNILSSVFFSDFIRSRTKLNYIDISQCSGYDEDSLFLLALHGSELTKVKMDGINLSSKFFKQRSKMDLRNLNIGFLRSYINIMKELDLSTCNVTDDPFIRGIQDPEIEYFQEPVGGGIDMETSENKGIALSRNLGMLNLQSCPNITGKTIRILCCNNSLDMCLISNTDGITPQVFSGLRHQISWPILTAVTRSLTKLDVEDCLTLLDNHLNLLGKLDELKELILRRCERISDSGLCRLATSISLCKLELETLNITDNGVIPFGNSPSLTSLTLINLPVISMGAMKLFRRNIYEIDESKMNGEYIPKIKKELEELVIKDCDGVGYVVPTEYENEKPLPVLCKAISQEHGKLSFENGNGLFDLNSLRFLESICPSDTISELNFNNTKLTNDAIDVLPRLSSLRVLSMRHCYLIADIRHLSGCTALVSLDLSYTNIMEVESLAKCTNLEKLVIEGCRNLVYDTLSSLNRTKLQHINISFLRQIDVKQVIQALSELSVQELTVSSEDRLSQANLKIIREDLGMFVNIQNRVLEKPQEKTQLVAQFITFNSKDLLPSPSPACTIQVTMQSEKKKGKEKIRRLSMILKRSSTALISESVSAEIEVIKEGELFKLSNSKMIGKKYQMRHFVLRSNGKIAYYTMKDGVEKGELDLSEYSKCKEAGERPKKARYFFILPSVSEDKKSYEFYAASEKQRDDWITEMNKFTK